MTQPELKTELGTMLCPLALNAEMEGGAEGGTPAYQAPDWIPILPAPNGTLLKGVDGRVFETDNLERVVSDSPMPAALDYDHAGAIAPFPSQPGKAAARITELQLREDGTTWGKVSWTKAGRSAVENGEYLFVSPVLNLAYNDDGAPELKYIIGAGLVNFPNFRVMLSINQQESPYMKPMNANEPVTTEPEGTTEPDAEPTTEPAANAAQIDMVPHAELEAALRQVNTMSEQVNEMHRREQERDKNARELAINVALDQAIADRKILPTSREYYAAQCRAEGCLEAFSQHVATLPQLLPDSSLDNVKPPAETLPAANVGENGAPADRTDAAATGLLFVLGPEPRVLPQDPAGALRQGAPGRPGLMPPPAP